MRRTLHTAKTAVAIVLAWVAGAVVATLLMAPEGEMIRAPARFFAVSVGVGVPAGLLSAWFELVLLPRFVRRLSSGQALLFWTAFYVVLATLLNALTFALLVSREDGRSLLEVLTSASFGRFLLEPAFWEPVALYTVMSFLINLARQVRLVLGTGTLTALLLGRYRRPVAEERVFMFVDLTGSTGLAQRLGPSRFNDFKNDFFSDVAQGVLETGGRIYQYVGDEVVATWLVRRGKARGNALRAFFLIEDGVRAAASRYARRYDAVPTFKAGVHAGSVVTAEIGYVKKDIVHSGDAVNVTARVEAQCHALGARLLASEEALGVFEVPTGARAEDAGLVALRGREGAVRLFRIERPSLPGMLAHQ